MSRSGRTALGLSSPDTADAKTKFHAQELRQILSDRMVEYQRLQTEWSSEQERLQADCEQLGSELRNLDLELAAARDAEKKKHLVALAQMKEGHKAELFDLQQQIDDALSAEDSKVEDNLDREIAAVQKQTADLGERSPPEEDIELVDTGADDRLQRLQEQLDELQQTHDEAIRQKDEESQRNMLMLEQVIRKHEAEEEEHIAKVEDLIKTLDALDRERNETIAEVRRELGHERSTVIELVNAASAKIQALQHSAAKRQREHSRVIRELQDKADKLRVVLEVNTARQEQQRADARVAARRIADETKRYALMSQEFQMLNTEKVREAIEHGTLMRELGKMDGFILAQMSAGTTGKRGSSSTARSKRF
jgi:hypothetical protein